MLERDFQDRLSLMRSTSTPTGKARGSKLAGSVNVSLTPIHESTAPPTLPDRCAVGSLESQSYRQ